jgi:hypothetical protein
LIRELTINNGKEKDMASKSLEARENQKEYWGSKLNQRLSFLTEKGFEPGKIAKDGTVRKFRAKIRETESKMKTIASQEKKVEEMARIKAEKAAAPKQEKVKKKKEVGQTAGKSKRQQKKSKKQESKSEE